VLEQFSEARVLFVGQHENVLGEEQYAARLAPIINQLGEHWTFLGLLSPQELSAFFQVADVTVLPSINETESFGLVQIESMTCGTPVIATDLPGVRVPVSLTKMGVIVPPADSGALAAALIDVLSRPPVKNPEATQITTRFTSAAVAAEYEAIFKEVSGK
jgi:glycosyltransferase involved in cell wall biosynthesis